MRLACLFLATAALAACSSEPAANEAAGVNVVTPEPAASNVTATAGAEPTDKSTPISQQSYDFAGSWAANEAACQGDGAWRFTRVKVEGEASCTIDTIRNETGVGATLDLSCAAGKQRWEVLTAPEGGMILQRYENEVMTGPQQRLVRCKGA